MAEPGRKQVSAGGATATAVAPPEPPPEPPPYADGQVWLREGPDGVERAVFSTRAASPPRRRGARRTRPKARSSAFEQRGDDRAG